MNKKVISLGLLLVLVFSTMFSTVLAKDAVKELKYIEKEIVEDTDQIKVSIPVVKGLKNEKYEKEVNNLIKSEAEKKIKEFKEELEGKDGELVINYDVKSEGDILSFVIETYKIIEGMANGETSKSFYNIRLGDTKEISIADMFEGNKDYKNMINNQIRKQIEERKDEFFHGEEGFKSISKAQTFYVNKKGDAVVVFDKYEIAPGSTGYPEFVTSKKPLETKDYVNVKYGFTMKFPPAWTNKIRIDDREAGIVKFIYTPENKKLQETDMLTIDIVEVPRLKKDLKDLVLARNDKYAYLAKINIVDDYKKDTEEQERYEIATQVLDGIDQMLTLNGYEPRKEEDIKVFDKVRINNKDYKLSQKIYVREGTTFIPIAEILRELDYDVKWDNDTRRVHISKGNSSSIISTKENFYSYNKALVIIDKKSDIKNDRTFTPVEYLERGLKLETSIVDGVLNIKAD